MNRIGVANMIAGLNRKNSTVSTTTPSQRENADTVKNPLYCPTPSPAGGSLRQSRFGSVKENIHKPRKSIIKPGSPIKPTSQAIAGSPIRQPRSPLTPADTNSPQRVSDRTPPSSPLTTRLSKAAKRHSRRFQRPPSFNLGTKSSEKVQEGEDAKTTSALSNIERIAAAVANNGTPMRMLPVPTSQPRPAQRGPAPPPRVTGAPPPPLGTRAQPEAATKTCSNGSLRKGLPRPPPRKAIQVMPDVEPKLTAQESTPMPQLGVTTAQTSVEDELKDTLTKIRKRGAVQVDYSIYQLVNLFTGTLPYSRSKKILDCMIEVCPIDQLVRWMMQSISGKGKNAEDKHKAADTLTSLLMMTTTQTTQREAITSLKSALEQQQNLAVLIKCMSEDDWVAKSYVTGILATLSVSPMRYLNTTECSTSSSESSSTESVANAFGGVTNQLYRSKSIDHGTLSSSSNSTNSVRSDIVKDSVANLSSYSYHSIPHIVGLLQSKSQEVREVALTTLLCMGPVAGGAAGDVADLLVQEKSAKVRVLCISALKEIGLPFILETIDVVEHAAKKDKDDNVRRAAAVLLESVNLMNEEVRMEIREADTIANTTAKKLLISEEFVRNSIRSLTRTQTGGVSQKDLEKYVEAEHIMITKECPRWRAQLRVVLRRMADKGAVAKQPATYRIA